MQSEHSDDQDPAPLRHSDAERVSREQSAQVPSSENTEELEDDPAHNPPDGPLRDVKGG